MVMAKTAAALDKKQATTLIDAFIDKFQKCCNHSGPANAAEFEKILSRNFQQTSNGQLIGRTLSDHLVRISNLQKKYSHLQIGPRPECLISGNKAVVSYEMNLTARNGAKSTLCFISIATIEDNLITQWTMVSHEKGRDYSQA